MYSIKYGDKLKTKKELFGAAFYPPESKRDGIKVDPPIPEGTIFTVNCFEIRVSDHDLNGILTYFTISAFGEDGSLNHQYSFTERYYKDHADHFHSLFE